MILPLRLAARSCRLVRAWLIFAAALGAILFTRSARADEAGGDASILLLVHGDELPKERLRDLVAKELHRPVALAGSGGSGSLGVVTVTYRKAQKELAVTWDGPKRGTVSRVVTAPPKVDDVVRDAAILAGNLARDEAAELMAPASPPTEGAPAPELPPDPLPPAAAVPAEPANATTSNVRSDESHPKKIREDLTLGVFYPLSTNMDRPWVRTRFDFNLFFGRIGQLDGFQLGGVNLIHRVDAKSSGDMNGMQLAYAANVVGGGVHGVQLAWLFNIGNELEGWQASTFFNHVDGNASGLQLSSVVNNVSGTLSGAQAGLVNVSRDVHGAQVGLINVGAKVSGAMIGLVNVADDIDGVPIGLASVTKSGGVHPQVWSSNATFANVGIKLATKHTYTMPSVHYHNAYDRDFVGAGFTIGGHIPLESRAAGAYIDTDLSFAWLIAPKEREFVARDDGDATQVGTYHEHIAQPRIRSIFGYRIADHFGLFGGVGVLAQVRLLRDANEALVRVGPEVLAGVEL